VIPADPTSLVQGDVVFIRKLKNPGSGKEPDYHFREAKIHEARPRVVFLKYKDDDYKLTHKVRPNMVFLDAEVKRISTVPAPVTVKEAAKDLDLSKIQKVETVIEQPPLDPDDLFGAPVSRKLSTKKATPAMQTNGVKPTSNGSAPPAFNVAEFKAWLEMGKTFAHVPARLKYLRQEAFDIAEQINALDKRLKEALAEEKVLNEQHSEMLSLLGESAEMLR